jgi:hypothetical protein
MAFAGLCPPGVGALKYMAMGRALFPILDKLLPKSNPVVLDCINQLSGFHHDGYRLLDSIMARILPVFNPSLSAEAPRWDEYGNITEMATHWNLYFRLVAKKGASFSPTERSLLFLNSITEHSLLGLVTSLKGSIQVFSDSLDEFEDNTPLPTHLNIQGLVKTLTSTQSPLTSSLAFAKLNTTKSTSLFLPNFGIVIPNIQGAASHATVTGPPYKRGGRRSNAPRRSTKGTVCHTCGLPNHEEIECRQLGRLLVMSQRAEKLPAHIKKKVIENFKKHYGLPLTPASHKTALRDLEEWYIARNVSEEETAAWFDWDGFVNYLEGTDVSDAESAAAEASE